MLTINEIFYSIQGESTRAGRPCVFVRLTACDLRCTWCDTEYAFYEGKKMSIDEVVGVVDAFGCPLVEITGGEPLLQDDVYPLMERLLADGRTVMLETGGHRPVDRVPDRVVKIMDVKCPGSGEADRNDWDNFKCLQPHDQVKFVIKDRQDYEYARDVVRQRNLKARAAAVHFSPVHGEMNLRTLSEWVLADQLPVRVQVQLHKFIWDPSTRGVWRGRSAERRARLVHGRGHRQSRGLPPARADRLVRPAARAGDRGGAGRGDAANACGAPDHPAPSGRSCAKAIRKRAYHDGEGKRARKRRYRLRPACNGQAGFPANLRFPGLFCGRADLYRDCGNDPALVECAG